MTIAEKIKSMTPEELSRTHWLTPCWKGTVVREYEKIKGNPCPRDVLLSEAKTDAEHIELIKGPRLYDACSKCKLDWLNSECK
ncbi:MAG: hypothetical protein NC218_01420 [Acetobacter sp.]|nr:hypothetical protein [Acetobacter sp.]